MVVCDGSPGPYGKIVNARHPDGRRYIIEAMGEVGTNGPQQVNDPVAQYGIALPRNRQYRGLVDRLPRLAMDRLKLTVFWMTRTVNG